MPPIRAVAIALVSTLTFLPGPVFAQSGPPSGGPGGPPPGATGAPPADAPGAAPPQAAAPPPGAITRDQFVQQRSEAAGRLFDRIDTQHLGYITRAQMRAFMVQRRGGRAAGGPPPEQQ